MFGVLVDVALLSKFCYVGNDYNVTIHTHKYIAYSGNICWGGGRGDFVVVVGMHFYCIRIFTG